MIIIEPTLTLSNPHTHHTQSHFCTESPTHNMQSDLQPPPTGNFTTVSIIVSKSLRQLPKTPLA